MNIENNLNIGLNLPATHKAPKHTVYIYCLQAVLYNKLQPLMFKGCHSEIVP